MKSRKIFILLLFTFLFMISNVCAKDVTQNDTKNMFNDKFHSYPDGYCYYNTNGIEDGTYNVIVAYSSDGTKAIANYNGNDKYIRNWDSNPGNLDDEAYKVFSASDYYKKNNSCPPIAYIHYVPVSNNIYLIDSKHYQNILNTFSYTQAKDNEESYVLITDDDDTTSKMSCKYTYDFFDNTASTVSSKKNIILNFNKNGRIINISDFNDRELLSTEILASYSYVNSICPNISICKVAGKSYSSGAGTTVTEYNYKIYYGDYTSDGQESESCSSYSCTNTNDSYCDPSSDDSNVCPIFSVYVDSLSTDFDNYQNAENSTRKRNAVNSYKENREYMVNWCNSVLSSQNSDDPCLNKCLTYNDVLTEYDSKILNKSSSTECGISNRLAAFINQILKIVKYALPVFVIIFGILDFIKAIASDKEDTMKKAQSRFVRRLIAAALVFIVPFILEFIIEKAGFIVEDCGLNWF